MRKNKEIKTIQDMIFSKAWEERILSYVPEENPFSTVPVKTFVAGMTKISKEEVLNLVRNAGWYGELILECTEKFPEDFKTFYETDSKVIDNTVDDMTFVYDEMETKTATLEEFLNYDFLRKEEMHDGVCIPAAFWGSQNVIQSVLKVVPYLAEKILSIAREQHLKTLHFGKIISILGRICDTF